MTSTKRLPLLPGRSSTAIDSAAALTNGGPTRMGLPKRLAALTALMAVLLVLGATEISLSISERTRLDDLRGESVALANTLAAFLSRVAPAGSPDALAQGLAGWSRKHITETTAMVFVWDGHGLVTAASSDSGATRKADESDDESFRGRTPVVLYRTGAGTQPAWQVVVPLGGGKVYGVLDVRVSTGRLQDWARLERRRAYALALLSALLVALGVAMLTARWVGQPLAELGRAMAGAHGGAEGAPPAREVGPSEFRALARRYNRLREALAARERESEARGALLTLEERARGYDRIALMEETAGGFAHEIGTPLNTLSGHLQLLRDDLQAGGDPKGVERVNLLLAHVDRVAKIVRAGLNRSAWPLPHAERNDLTEIAGRMLRFMEPSFVQAGVTALLNPVVGLVPAARPAMAVCDPAQVEQVLLNLLKNAIEALPPGGIIEVRTGLDGRTAFVEIADNGPGLAPEAQAHLFHPFVTTKGTAGTGLGLAVSRRLARALGGDLVYIRPERGTRWRLTLPTGEV